MVAEEEDDKHKGKVKNSDGAAAIKNRGFYVRMRFLHKKQGKSQHLHLLQCNSSNNSSCNGGGGGIIDNFFILILFCNYKCFKWFLLWLLISIYILFTFSFLLPSSSNNGNNNDHNNISSSSSLIISSSSIVSLSRTKAISHHLASRALSESSTNNNSSSSTTIRSTTASSLLHVQSSKNQDSVLNDLMIYVYELPSKYNEDWLINKRCSNHLFASEVAIHRALLTSRFRTFDPYEADFFFVPVYVSCNFSTVNGFPAIGHARSLISSAIGYISNEFPFWNRSGGGEDHVFVASHDFGACFHTMEDVAIADGIPEMLKKSIILQTFGVTSKHPCQHKENSIVIPPYIPPETVRSTLLKFPLNDIGRRRRRRRDIFAFFRGKMELHPKNVSGRFYSKAVRTKIWNKFNTDNRFYLKRQRYPGYQTEISRSIFCLCPLGWAPWSPRLVESVALGCIPVILADNIRLPFSNTIPWQNISLTVPENDVEKLGQILDYVTTTNLSTIQTNIWDQPNVRRALLFHVPMIDGDATWNVLVELSKKVGYRSYKRTKGFDSIRR